MGERLDRRFSIPRVAPGPAARRRTLRLFRHAALAAAAVLATVADRAEAVRFSGRQTAPGEWTYTLVYEPRDNYAICQPTATITLTGLAGVTRALPPLATDYELAPLHQANLAWRAEVLDSGRSVRWSGSGGTGNFDRPRRVFGFRVIAPNAENGRVSVVTQGFERDEPCPAARLDVTAGVDGPVERTTFEDPRWQIGLRSRAFTPPAAPPPDLESRVGRVLDAKAAAGEIGRAHLMLQLDRDLTQGERQDLSRSGLHLLQSLGRTAWLASVDRAGLSRLRGTRGLRWADTMAPDDKMDPRLDTSPIHAYRLRPGGLVTYSVRFHDDAPYEEAVALLGRLGGSFESPDAGDFGFFHGGVVRLPPDAVRRLAADDLVAWIEAGPPPQAPGNLAAQQLSDVDDVHNAPYNLTGTGVTVGLWEAFERGSPPPGSAVPAPDGATPHVGHNDFGGRVRVAAGEAGPVSNHATHVAGTLAGDPPAGGAAFQGMAPGATLLSYDVLDDTGEMQRAATLPTNPVRISNHSYGAVIGWSTMDPTAAAGNRQSFFTNRELFGQYNQRSEAFDQVVTGRGLVVVKSADNDRDETWGGAAANPVQVDGVATSFGCPGCPAAPPRDCRQGGLGVDGDCIPPVGSAKNVLTVGALDNPNQLEDFSNFGPTDDGRIKPDLVADGDLVSAVTNDANHDGVADCATPDACHENMHGTSMSTPVVTGLLACLMEAADGLGIDFAPSSYKAALVHTARDFVGGPATVGPDFASGWGIADADAAADLLRTPGGPALVEDEMTAAGAAGARTYRREVAAGEAELRVTLAWDDPAAFPGALRALVNDLDLTLISPSGVVFTPWRLDPANPGNPAVIHGGTDDRNNVEQVLVRNPEVGTWTVRVGAQPANLPRGPQRFSLAGVQKLELGRLCSRNLDCGALRGGRGYCADGARCAPPDGFGELGDYCHHDEHCRSGLSCLCVGPSNGAWCDGWESGNRGECGTPRGLGEDCGQDRDCAVVRGGRRYCANGRRCAPPNDTGEQGDYCHHDDHCLPGLSCMCVGPKNGPWCHDWEGGNRGVCGDGLGLGQNCSRHRDCAAVRGGRGYCANGARCAPPNGTGVAGDYCHHDDHCGAELTCVCQGAKNGPWCHDWERGNRGTCQTGLGLGSDCSRHRDCAAVRGGRGYCANGARCAPPNGTGVAGDYCHHDDHCDPSLRCRCTGPKNGPWCHDWESGNRGVCGP